MRKKEKNHVKQYLKPLSLLIVMVMMGCARHSGALFNDTNNDTTNATPPIHTPIYPSDYEDTDGDGFLNAVDAFPKNRYEWVDFDGNGVGDNAQAAATRSYDDDNDGTSDWCDAFPLDATRWDRPDYINENDESVDWGHDCNNIHIENKNRN